MTIVGILIANMIFVGYYGYKLWALETDMDYVLDVLNQIIVETNDKGDNNE